MKRVILVRHGKSSWDDPTLDDHDRPLNARGKRAAPLTGAWLAKKGLAPDAVLCSSSKRTRQTAKRLAEALPLPEPVIERGLYHAAPVEMRDRLTVLDTALETVMVIGHQPGIGALARKLSGGKARPRCARAFEHFPTAAAAVLEFDIDDWSDLEWATGRFVDFAMPRELDAA